MPVVDVTDQTFAATVASTSTPIIVDFWATWCGPCYTLSKTLALLASESAGKLTVLKVNVEDNPEVAAQFGARSLPFLIFLKDGNPVGQLAGNPSLEKLKKSLPEGFV